MARTADAIADMVDFWNDKLVEYAGEFEDIWDALALKQAADSDLTAIAALTTTSYGRALLTLANQAALRTSVGAIELRTLTPTNGGTSNVAASTAQRLILDCNHAATIASHTINLPTLLDGQVVEFASRSAITACTVNPSGSQTGAAYPTSFTAGGHASFRWNTTANYLFRIE